MSNKEMVEKGHLARGEPHPAAYDAKEYLLGLPQIKIELVKEILSSVLPDNRHAEICNETLDRLLSTRPVSDRYLLGLAWYVRHIIKID